VSGAWDAGCVGGALGSGELGARQRDHRMNAPLSPDVGLSSGSLGLPSATDSVLSDDSDGSASAGSEESLHLSWVRLSPGVIRCIRISLGGPFGGAATPAKARLWATLGPTALGCSGGYLVHTSFGTVSAQWAALGWPGGIAMALTGLTIAECTCHMAFAIRGMARNPEAAAQVANQGLDGGSAGSVGSVHNHADGDSVGFLETLLTARLSPSVAAAADYRQKLAWCRWCSMWSL
jgi:hypothetical protein